MLQAQSDMAQQQAEQAARHVAMQQAIAKAAQELAAQAAAFQQAVTAAMQASQTSQNEVITKALAESEHRSEVQLSSLEGRLICPEMAVSDTAEKTVAAEREVLTVIATQK